MIEDLLIYFTFAAGFLGAILRNAMKNNSLVMPKFVNGNIVLGFIGCGLTGGAIGLATGKNPTTAFFAGYTGMSVLPKILPQEVLQPNTTTETPEQTIRRICKAEMVDADIAVRVAKCESGLNPLATNKNTDGSIDRGIFQINDKYHPEVSIDQAFDVDYATRFFCKAFKSGNLSWWEASKKCWSV